MTRSTLNRYERFGGLTTVLREFPLRGLWSGESETYRDLIVIYTTIDFEPSESTTQFFEGYKEILKSRFQQEEILTGLTHFRVLTCQGPAKSLTFGEVMVPFQ